MSERQQVTAIRVANIPADDFERQVESDQPPTVTRAYCPDFIARGRIGRERMGILNYQAVL